MQKAFVFETLWAYKH